MTSVMPRIISTDDHVIEPANLWIDRLPKRYHDVGPRKMRAPLGEHVFRGGVLSITVGTEGPDCDWWVYEDLMVPHTRNVAAVGVDRDDLVSNGITYEDMRPGCYDPIARLADMDVNHIEASICFPTFPRFCGQTFLEAKDKELALLCVQAYNDWMVEEWCAPSGGRLVPLCIIPLWDAHLAAAEVRRNADRGVRAVCFSEAPYMLGLPSVHDKDRYWDPFFAACDETGTVIAMHHGSGSRMPSTSADAPPGVVPVLSHQYAESSLADWLLSGVLARFPNLVITYSEGQIGWIPYVLNRADRVWEWHRAWAGLPPEITEPPSTYYWNRVYGCFYNDPAGLAMLDMIGPDQVTFETDYPHAECTWPNTREDAERQFGHLDQETVNKLARDNAARMLGLEVAS